MNSNKRRGAYTIETCVVLGLLGGAIIWGVSALGTNTKSHIERGVTGPHGILGRQGNSGATLDSGGDPTGGSSNNKTN